MRIISLWLEIATPLGNRLLILSETEYYLQDATFVWSQDHPLMIILGKAERDRGITALPTFR